MSQNPHFLTFSLSPEAIAERGADNCLPQRFFVHSIYARWHASQVPLDLSGWKATRMSLEMVISLIQSVLGYRYLNCPAPESDCHTARLSLFSA
jgi:hypothetical protein